MPVRSSHEKLQGKEAISLNPALLPFRVYFAHVKCTLCTANAISQSAALESRPAGSLAQQSTRYGWDVTGHLAHQHTQLLAQEH